MKAEPYITGWWTATLALQAIEQWALPDAYLVRETGLVIPNGRLDGLLVPAMYRGRVASPTGVELKLSRGDFLRGLKSGQYSRYLEHVGSLYLAAPLRVIEADEVPRHCGWLCLSRNHEGEARCICRRRPRAPSDCRWPEEVLWRIFWQVLAQFRETEIRESRERCQRLEERICALAAAKMSAWIGKETRP